MTALALRILLARRRQTLLMLLGIFFGSMAFVSMSGMMLGFRAYFVHQLVSNAAHVHIQPRELFLEEHSLDSAFFGAGRAVAWASPPSGREDSARVENPQAWYRRLGADPRVEAYSPQLTASVIFSKGQATWPAALTGCDPIEQVKVTSIGEYVIEGRFSDLAGGGNRLVLGEELAKKLGVRASQTLYVSPARGSPQPFKVAAVFRTGSRLFDTQAFGALGDVQKLNGTPHQVNEIAVRLKDYTRAASVAADWGAVSPEKVESWDMQNGNIYSVFRIQDAVRFLSIGAVLIVAGFGIYNVLTMTVLQKRRDIAILRSMGYGTGDIIMLFFSQGLLLGVTGTSLGLLAGYGLSFALEAVPFSGGPMGSGVGHLIISRDPAIYVQAGLLALLSALVSSVLPARSAGRMSPIEIIRSGAE